MSEIYNREYYSNYDVGVDKVDYAGSQYTKGFLETIADRIVADLHPKTVLDAGCAMGYLVAALRDRGVEAYGIDISEYAISQTREDIRPYCFVGSLTEPLPEGMPERFDLVTNIEVLEHLYADDGKKAAENLCAVTDCIVFSSTPDDFRERTHVNVQQREYWARLFAAAGFYDDLNYRPTYLTAYASCFRRKDDWLRQIEDYERNIRMTEAQYGREHQEWLKALEDKDRHIQVQNQIIEDKERHIQDQDQIIGDKERHIQNQNQIIEDKERHIQDQSQIIGDKERHIQNQNRIIEDKERHIQDQGQIIEDKERHIQDQDQIIEDKERHIQDQSQIIEEKERRIQDQSQIIEEKDRRIQDQDRVIGDDERCIREQSEALAAAEERKTELSRDLDEMGRELAHYKEHYFAAINQREELKAQLAASQNAYSIISNAACWKMTKPLRVCLDLMKKYLWNNRVTLFLRKGSRCLREHGFRYTWQKLKDKLCHRQDFQALRPLYTPAELEEQRNHRFPREVRFSIIVPLYNTPKEFLQEMIQSVLDQTYGDWELCLADGSDRKHSYVKSICEGYARKDKRIVYRKLEYNGGISSNTNACIDMATGDYIALLDHDDLLHPAALYDVMKAICEKDADFVYTDENTFRNKPKDAYCPHFKPDYAPDTLRSYNYICHFTVFSRDLLDETGAAFRSRFDGSQDYDLVLRLTEKAKHIVHIPKILYYWRASAASVASDVSAKPYTLEAARSALAEHLERVGLEGEVLDGRIPSTYQIQYEIGGEPLVSIIIPNKDHVDDLKKCIDSIAEKTTYPNWEIIIVENNSTEESTFAYYDSLEEDERIRVVTWKGKFNYSAINNFGAKYAGGEHLLLLNNDVEVITPDWMEQMLMFSQRKDVGAVGAMLYYPDDTMQHAGVIVGLGGVAGHSHKFFPRGHCGYMYRLTLAQNLSAVTAACMMMRRAVWEEIGGLDESFEVAFNDVDLCMRIRKAGYLIVWTPFAELYHYESKSRGLEDTPEKQERFRGEVLRFQKRWRKELAAGDPYYNPNFTLDREDFSLR